MNLRNSKVAFAAVSVLGAGLILSGCSSTEGEAKAQETSSAASSSTSKNATPDKDYKGERTALVGAEGSPTVSVILPPGWTHGDTLGEAAVTDILFSSGETDENGFRPNTTLVVRGAGALKSTSVLLKSASREVRSLSGWSEKSYQEIEIDGQKAVRLDGSWVSDMYSTPILVSVVSIAYSGPNGLHFFSFANSTLSYDKPQIQAEFDQVMSTIKFT